MSYITRNSFDLDDLERRKNQDYHRMVAMQQQGMAGLIGSGGMSMQQALSNLAVPAQPEKKPEKLLLLL